MRLPRTLLLTVLATALAVPFLIAASAAALPPNATTSYHWQQPGCAPVTTTQAQPPAWITMAAPTVSALPGFTYQWAQLGCAPVQPSHVQPPAWIPTG